ncbi:hypothetical protein L6452_34093 [Arctium lappa]|uniref:Uncharacterized protein n=1 Tax=Arctium lappa TaxID=4217 RepID=A0ACB8YIE6_ARCLA|nr:hypothetical protein L6452_34093 [Arctium lappa]
MEKLGLVGHVAPTKKEKIKAYLKVLPAYMMLMVNNSKDSNLRETIEEAQILEDVYARDNLEKVVVVGEKRKWQSNYGPPNSAEASTMEIVTPLFTLVPSVGNLIIPPETALEKGEPSRVSGRAFQMTTCEAKASTDVVSGTFFLNSVPARVLFDSSARFSFISESFRQNLVMPTNSLENALVVEIANGSQVLIRDVLRECTLGIEGKEFLIKLMLMVIGGFDVVVGMDWLAKNHAEILCSKKMI